MTADGEYFRRQAEMDAIEEMSYDQVVLIAEDLLEALQDGQVQP